ncbi:MAG: serine hydrolase [Candidatus Saccharicenans sp.]|nr:serine hydrolase [Candidatus Saccharicenans sp.]
MLKKEEMDLAFSPVKVPEVSPTEADGSAAAYGFGWFLNPWKGQRLAWHHGETAGFRTSIQRLIAEGLTVIVLGNRDDLNASDLALKIAQIYSGQEKEAAHL